MVTAWLQNIDPKTVENQRSPIEIELKRASEARDVPVQNSDEVSESRISDGQIVQRGIRCISRIIIGFRPILSRPVGTGYLLRRS